MWFDDRTKRVLEHRPLELVEAPSFKVSTHWLDEDTMTLLRKRPALVETPRAPLCCIQRHRAGELATMYRNHFTGELSFVNPVDAYQSAGVNKCIKCCRCNDLHGDDALAELDESPAQSGDTAAFVTSYPESAVRFERFEEDLIALAIADAKASATTVEKDGADADRKIAMRVARRSAVRRRSATQRHQRQSNEGTDDALMKGIFDPLPAPARRPAE
jgi:hypothetical protein